MEPAPPTRSNDLIALADRLAPYRRARGGGRRYAAWLSAQRERIRRTGWFN